MRYYLSALLLLSLPSGAYAEDYLDMDLEELSRLEVTSTSKTSGLYEAPANVTILTAEDIRRFGYRTFAEALRRIAGLYTFSDGVSEYLGVRGFASPTNLSQRALVLVDGHPLTDPFLNYVRIGDEVPVDIESVERIEVIKGPVSAVWGTGALLGVINIITRPGRNINGVRGTAEVGSLGRKKGFVEFGAVKEGGFEYSAGVGVTHSEGRDSIYYSEYDTERTNRGIAENVEHDESGDLYLKGSYGDLSATFVHGWRREEDPTARFGTRFNTDENVLYSAETHASLRYQSLLTDTTSLFTRLFFDRDSSRVYFRDLPAFADVPSSLSRLDLEYSTVGAEINLSHAVNESMNLLIGHEVSHALEMTNLLAIREPFVQRIQDVEFNLTVVSGYGELHYKLLEGTQLVGSVRLDHYSTVGDQWSPRLGLRHSLSPNTELKFIVSEAYRAPSMNELYEVLGTEKRRIPGLRSEEIRSFEAIVERAFGARSKGNFTLFHHEMKNPISLRLAPATITAENIGDARSYGGEIAFESHSDGDVLFRASGALLNAEDRRTGSRLPNAPRFSGNLSLSYPLFGPSLYLSPELYFLGERRDLQGGSINDAWVTNLTLLHRDAAKGLRLSAGVYNLFDQTIYSPGSVFHLQSKLPEPGRTWRFQLSFNF